MHMAMDADAYLEDSDQLVATNVYRTAANKMTWPNLMRLPHGRNLPRGR